jgi:hypothetical protein
VPNTSNKFSERLSRRYTIFASVSFSFPMPREAKAAYNGGIFNLKEKTPMRWVGVFPLVLMLLGSTVLFERPAYAYVDPGSGLLAVQAVGSALVATGWYLRRRIYMFFQHVDSSKREPEKPPDVRNSEEPTRR